MIVDTSALLAILFDEPDAERYARALADADTVRLSAGSFVEALTSATASPTPSRGQPPSRCSSRAGISARPISHLRSPLRRNPANILAGDDPQRCPHADALVVARARHGESSAFPP